MGWGKGQFQDKGILRGAQLASSVQQTEDQGPPFVWIATDIGPGSGRRSWASQSVAPWGLCNPCNHRRRDLGNTALWTQAIKPRLPLKRAKMKHFIHSFVGRETISRTCWYPSGLMQSLPQKKVFPTSTLPTLFNLNYPHFFLIFLTIEESIVKVFQTRPQKCLRERARRFVRRAKKGLFINP